MWSKDIVMLPSFNQELEQQVDDAICIFCLIRVYNIR